MKSSVKFVNYHCDPVQRRQNLRQVMFLERTAALSSSKLRFLKIDATCKTRWPASSLAPIEGPRAKISSRASSSERMAQ